LFEFALKFPFCCGCTDGTQIKFGRKRQSIGSSQTAAGKLRLDKKKISFPSRATFLFKYSRLNSLSTPRMK
jgi:hypothetical protein